MNKNELVKNSLGYDTNLWVYQDKKMFNYSVDTILLANFATINSKTKKVLEVGTNNGALSIFLSERYSKMKIDAIEIQKKAVQIAKLNIKENKKEKQINVIEYDFKEYWKNQNRNQSDKYDLIICNPPFYMVENHKKRKGNEWIEIATHEIKMTLEDLIKGSTKIIKQKGYLTIVEATERLVDVFETLRKYKFEPKRVQMIHPRTFQKSNLVLVEARFNTGYGTKFLNNIYLHPDSNLNDHTYLPKVKKLYKPLNFEKGEKYE
ncbi:MAG: tRNA1(Val) (adenine(37)-N6)-methyltransferase [Mollicutes bacterium PWAP]|nr:tRNA1(Val) (adenine(37)-N6)-methyltransferase [Mollicutes bacterium PWAP]